MLIIYLYSSYCFFSIAFDNYRCLKKVYRHKKDGYLDDTNEVYLYEEGWENLLEILEVQL